jgi:lipopolysaccharide/colanic/teichoic acid biosynthesis glycosyltransferase
MYKNLFKRVVDLILALIALPFWLIILFVIGSIIYFQDKGFEE